MNRVPEIAQSNIQLCGQLQRHGYGSADISDVARAYRLAQQLFSRGIEMYHAAPQCRRVQVPVVQRVAKSFSSPL